MLHATRQSIAVVLTATLCATLVSCGGLPSTFDVQRKFAAEHPQYVITNVMSRPDDAIEHRSGSDGGYIHGDTVFTVTYRKPAERAPIPMSAASTVSPKGGWKILPNASEYGTQSI